VVRCAWFMQNFSEDYLVGPILDGEVVVPARDELEPFVDADDIADVATAALTDDRHIGEVYELTSPRLMGRAEVVHPDDPGRRAQSRGRPAERLAAAASASSRTLASMSAGASVP
jgi:uncharacterized protein YbjT (DUF2867 family)